MKGYNPSMRRAFIILMAAAFTGLLTSCSHLAADEGPPVEPLLRSTVYIAVGDGHGSGMIVGPGLVLTAYHAVRTEDRPGVRFYDGQSANGKVVWTAPGRDLALIAVDIPKGHPVPPMSCDDIAPGERIIAVGHPLQSEWVAVSGHMPEWQGYHDRYVSLGLRIGQGASGGPVFDNEGQVVGIVLNILTRRLYAKKGIGYMLPARDFCQTIREKRASYAPKP